LLKDQRTFEPETAAKRPAPDHGGGGRLDNVHDHPAPVPSPGPPGSTTTTARVVVFCELGDYTVRVFTDRPVYDRGQQV
jgi:hypothetical protein